MSDAELKIATAGFSTELWSPEHGWEANEAEASEDPFPPQMLAAMQCFLAFFVSRVQRFWVHLAAEMQAGKTGVVGALIRLVLNKNNFRILNITPSRIFVLTGMNDNAWKKQTRDRLPGCLRQNVYHNGSLPKFVKAITTLAAGSELRNVLIILDESHIASCTDNRPQTLIYNTVKELCRGKSFQENNIRFLTISATDPAKVLSMREEERAQVVRLQTTNAYQSIESLAGSGRTRWLETFGDVHQDKAMRELKRCIAEEYADGPRYHIIRARSGKSGVVVEKLAAEFPGCRVLKFDSDKSGRATDDGSSSTSEITDINEILREAPEQHTFIVIKNMFYAAKTLEDEFVGVLWDRLGGKDDTNLQSLLGRACGYGKSSRTVVYAARNTVDNYQNFWRELCSNERTDMAVLTGVPTEKIKRMPGVVATRVADGIDLAAAGSASNPMTAGAAAAAGGGGGRRAAATHVSVSHLEEFRTMEELRQCWAAILAGSGQELTNPRTPNQKDGVFVCSIGAKSEKQTAQAIRAKFGGDSTSNWGSGLTTAAVGEYIHRVYAGYDSEGVVFFLRWTKKE